VIEACGVTKKYGKTAALSGIDFSIPEGELFGIIGPDGAGKTTLFRVLATLLLADAGRVSVCGFDAVREYRKIRNVIGYMPGRFSLYQDLTVEENLSFFATVFNTTIEANYGLIRDIYVQLEPFRRRRASALSGGMKQKLALCCALIHKPRVLFLDEPTTGVDPVSRTEFWNMLDVLKGQGMTILVSTPYMDEAGRCDRIALMRNGRFLTTDSPSRIVERYEPSLCAVSGDAMFPILKDLRKLEGIHRCFPFGDSHHVSYDGSRLGLGDITAYLEGIGHAGIAVRGIPAGIEDCFMELSPEVESV